METLLLLLGLIVSPEQHQPAIRAETAQVVKFPGEGNYYDIPELDAVRGELPDTAGVPAQLQGPAAVIAACESGHRLADGSAALGTHDWTVENPSPSSSASGAFQFLTGTWNWVWEDLIGEQPPAARAMYASPADQIRAFEALWNDGRGSHHWDASRSCWGRMLPS